MKTFLSYFILSIFTMTVNSKEKEFSSDLVVLDASTSKHYSISGESFTISVETSNWGTSASTSGVILGYYLSKNNIRGDADDIWFSATTSVPTIASLGSSHTSQTLIVPNSLMQGAYNLYIEVDINNQESESNETNNWNRLTFFVGRPDFEFASTTASSEGAPGGIINITGNLINDGIASVQSFSKLKIVLSENQFIGDFDDIPITEYSVGWMGPASGGQSFSFNISWFIPPDTEKGSYNIIIKADFDNDITESNESNNIIYHFIQIDASPDLVPIDMHVNQGSFLTEGDFITVDIDVLNNGTEAVPGGATYRIKLILKTFGQPDIEFHNTLTSIPSSGLGPGVTYEAFVATALPPELTNATTNFDLVAIINEQSPFNTIIESNYFNNTVSIPITIDDDGGGISDPGGPLRINTEFDTKSDEQQIETKSLILYPNPTENSINLILASKVNFELVVLDLFGNVKANESFKNTNRATLDVKGYDSGVYILKIISEGFEVTKKFLKNRN